MTAHIPDDGQSEGKVYFDNDSAKLMLLTIRLARSPKDWDRLLHRTCFPYRMERYCRHTSSSCWIRVDPSSPLVLCHALPHAQWIMKPRVGMEFCSVKLRLVLFLAVEKPLDATFEIQTELLPG